jgi:nitrite reductase/ring-hydroxylating ferredoxin subunit
MPNDTTPNDTTLARRGLFMKLGMLLNGVVAAALAVPIGRFMLSSITRTRERLPRLGIARPCQSFPGRRDPAGHFPQSPRDAHRRQDLDTACWVRHVGGDEFQVFAVNCAHLGCPVRWFPQSGLFMCPCHGGAYYRDGSRASGPPERGLFEYPNKVENGLIRIQAGELPTPGPGASLERKEPPCCA